MGTETGNEEHKQEKTMPLAKAYMQTSKLDLTH